MYDLHTHLATADTNQAKCRLARRAGVGSVATTRHPDGILDKTNQIHGNSSSRRDAWTAQLAPAMREASELLQPRQPDDAAGSKFQVRALTVYTNNPQAPATTPSPQPPS